MYNCYNCRKNYDGVPPYSFGNESYCTSCEKYMPSNTSFNYKVTQTPVLSVDTKKEEKVKPIEMISNKVIEYISQLEDEKIRLPSATKNLVYRFFRCNRCEKYYENFSGAIENLKNAEKCCNSSVTPYVICKHGYRWKKVEEAIDCCGVIKESLELKR